MDAHRLADPACTGSSSRAAASDASEASAAAPLDLHEGIDDPPASGCTRWPEHLRLLNVSTGELQRGRCRATNLCRYCQRLYVVETVEMLTLDALEHAPTLWIVLTAREHLTRAECRRHLAQLRRSLRKRWPGIEWFVQVEFQRRGALHLNLLVKGVPVEDRRELEQRTSALWCARVDAHPVGQWSGEVNDGEGLVRYLAKTLAHGLKAEQAPPIGWRGHRTSQTRGYLVRPASVMREEARAALRVKRRLWRALAVAEGIAGGPPPADFVEFVADALEAQERDARWELRQVRPLSVDAQRQLVQDARRPLRRPTRVNGSASLPEGNDRRRQPATEPARSGTSRPPARGMPTDVGAPARPRLPAAARPSRESPQASDSAAGRSRFPALPGEGQPPGGAVEASTVSG